METGTVKEEQSESSAEYGRKEASARVIFHQRTKTKRNVKTCRTKHIHFINAETGIVVMGGGAAVDVQHGAQSDLFDSMFVLFARVIAEVVAKRCMHMESRKIGQQNSQPNKIANEPSGSRHDESMAARTNTARTSQTLPYIYIGN